MLDVKEAIEIVSHYFSSYYSYDINLFLRRINCYCSFCSQWANEYKF